MSIEENLTGIEKVLKEMEVNVDSIRTDVIGRHIGQIRVFMTKIVDENQNICDAATNLNKQVDEIIKILEKK